MCQILLEQQPPQGVFVCDYAGRVINKFSFHGQIRILPDLCAHPLLEELRLNDNRIMKVAIETPETVRFRL